jgi:transcriptional activator of cad operon
MTAPATAKLRIGDWCVDPAMGRISRGDEVVRVEERTLRLLLELARRPGEVVGINDLLERVWAGVTVTPDSVYQSVASLRRQLGDDPKQPRYIATVPRLGYRLVAPVAPWTEGRAERESRRRRPNRWVLSLGGALAALALAGAWLAYDGAWRDRHTTPPAGVRQGMTVGVAPFVDLTPSMDQEQLADEMTEGVADRLSRNPAMRTPGFRSSFYLIGKQVTLAQAARKLGVALVVDGSVRKNGDAVRVSARLTRAETGVTLWSETYNRPLREIAIIQDAIAAAIAKTMAAA